MSQENVEIVRRLIAANRSDDRDASIEAFMTLIDPTCEYTRVTAQVEPQTYRGHDELRRYFHDMAEVWREWRCEPEGVRAVGPDMAVATVRFHGIGSGSGAAIEARLGLLAVFSEGKVVRARAYPSREDALKAAGLPE